MKTDNHVANSIMLWLNAAPLKVNNFEWSLFLNRIPTKDNLFKRGVILDEDQQCMGGCGSNEDAAHF